jgi:hypothetical protein
VHASEPVTQRADPHLQEQIMNFRTYVEPPEPMKGLEIPAAVVQALGAGKRPAVRITINRHSWKSRVAIMRGRYLLGLSNANRQAAGVVTGDEVEVDVEIDAEPRVVVEPADFAPPWTPIRSPVTPTSAYPTAASASRCSLSTARRRPRHAYGATKGPWQRYATRTWHAAAPPVPRLVPRHRPVAGRRSHDRWPPIRKMITSWRSLANARGLSAG